MSIAIEAGWLLGVLLISVRLAAFLFASPLFALGRVPARVLVIVVMVFSAAINVHIDQYGALAIARIDELLIATARELSVGLLMAFGVHCAFAAFSFGGRILDLQMGFGVANLVSPASNEQAPLLGTALLMTGVMTFLLVDGHHWLAKGFVQSYQWFPLGAPLRAVSLSAIVQQFGLMFSLGTVLVAPVVVVLLLLDGVMAIAARTMPQMNIFMLSIPIKITAGLLVLALSVPYMKGMFEQIFASIFAFWNALV